jgi:hypothetical protein
VEGNRVVTVCRRKKEKKKKKKKKKMMMMKKKKMMMMIRGLEEREGWCGGKCLKSLVKTIQKRVSHLHCHHHHSSLLHPFFTSSLALSLFSSLSLSLFFF